MLLFHGTSVENAKNILQNGFNYDNSIWNCSGNETYFFTEQFFKDEFGLDSEDDVLSSALQETFQQSLISLAIQNPSDYRGAVLVFDTELMNNKSQIEEDYSCPNMSDRAVCLKNPDMAGLVGMYVMDDDQRALRLFTLASLANNEYLNEAGLSPVEQSILQAISSNDSIMCEIHELTQEIQYTKQILNTNQSLLEVA